TQCSSRKSGSVTATPVISVVSILVSATVATNVARNPTAYCERRATISPASAAWSASSVGGCRSPSVRPRVATSARSTTRLTSASASAVARRGRGLPAPPTNGAASSSATTVTCEGGVLRPPAPPGGNASTNSVTI